MRLLLDTNLLKRLCHPTTNTDVKSWFDRALTYVRQTADAGIYISSVADYELRRWYLWKLVDHKDAEKGRIRLDQFCTELGVHAVSNEAFKDAALLWAQARKGGYSTAAEDRPEWDAVLAAQARELDATVVTENTRHLARYGVDAKDWYDVPIPAEEL